MVSNYGVPIFRVNNGNVIIEWEPKATSPVVKKKYSITVGKKPDPKWVKTAGGSQEWSVSEAVEHEDTVKTAEKIACLNGKLIIIILLRNFVFTNNSLWKHMTVLHDCLKHVFGSKKL